MVGRRCLRRGALTTPPCVSEAEGDVMIRVREDAGHLESMKKSFVWVVDVIQTELPAHLPPVTAKRKQSRRGEGEGVNSPLCAWLPACLYYCDNAGKPPIQPQLSDDENKA